MQTIKLRDFLKGGSAIFQFSFQDISPLVDGKPLPCPTLGKMRITHPPEDHDHDENYSEDHNEGPCASRTTTTTPPSTTDDDDKSVFDNSSGMKASYVLALLPALILFMP
ncbi:hypothetical protein LDENG_00152970 [Lucifuga dentata]|nr:hypothetical protein LDENG_00152970 [Lucifuga dentata]